eukprot:gnl/TRDRNA2_/TRDRNA2_135491_c0_seq1.p1 gnl/TRDRNA2_/TRDRNA2_135491_c0~~gnl/TRDRNA2_/TRDRNA2_135491_c0_seq1.p1  ORF type:complete len:143 (+),score=26.02 gnl/TRDRNA2_/TRDRNA2_135491_c0_seq1:71-499(+)
MLSRLMGAARTCRPGSGVAYRMPHAWRCLATERDAEGTTSGDADKASADLGDDVGGGLFCDAWWPRNADTVFKQLARRPQGLPEDPLAHGILSYIEYELACKPLPKEGEAVEGAEEAKAATDPGWDLRGRGEVVFPRGEQRG